MKANTLLLCALMLLLTGCSSSQYAGVVAGSSLGGMFGSSIGGLLGGPRGHDVGTAVGMLAGGALGAAATAPKTSESADAVDYGERYTRSTASVSQWGYLEVTNLRFSDSNGNKCLDPGEHAYIEMEIYNRGDNTLYDIAPIVTCDNRRMSISPTAIVSELAPGRGFRYKVEIVAPRRMKADKTTFNVAFGDKKERVNAKTFNIRSRR